MRSALDVQRLLALDKESVSGWVRAMRCLSCGGEMQLIGLADDRELVVPGYIRHTFECTDCGETETRLLFTRERPVPAAPARETQDRPKGTRKSTWEQAIDKLRNHQVVLSTNIEMRKASERASERAAEFNRKWDHALPRREPKSGSQPRSEAPTLWARAVARLRPVPGSER